MTKNCGIRCLINGDVISHELIGPPAMNYGQLDRWQAFERVQYDYVMAVPDFIDHVSPWFAQYCEELKADCRIAPPDEDTPEHALAGLGYPRLDQLIRTHSVLAGQLFLSLPLELNNLFAPKIPILIRYAANSVDRFSCEGGEIRFGGVAFDVKPQRMNSKA